jgi:hypothetical protein
MLLLGLLLSPLDLSELDLLTNFAGLDLSALELPVL